MRFILLLFTLSPFISFSQVKVQTPYYTVIYSEEYQQPLLLEYTVLCDYYSESISRSNYSFYKNDSIITSDDLDYYKNIWDKGHLAPAAHFNCNKEALLSTFSYLNCVLQHQDLNRKTWKYLEEYERKLSITGNVFVRVEVKFKKSRWLETGSLIPSGFLKYIYVNDELIGIWYFENKSPISSDIFFYKIK